MGTSDVISSLNSATNAHCSLVALVALKFILCHTNTITVVFSHSPGVSTTTKSAANCVNTNIIHFHSCDYHTTTARSQPTQQLSFIKLNTTQAVFVVWLFSATLYRVGIRISEHHISGQPHTFATHTHTHTVRSSKIIQITL